MTPTSAVLLNYRRPDNLRPMIEQIQRVPWITEILVWNNGAPLEPVAGVEVIQAPLNFLLLPRLLLAMLARGHAIWFQDDDLVLTSEQITAVGAVYDQWCRLKICGVQGRQIGPGLAYVGENVFGRCDVVNQGVLVSRERIQAALAHLPDRDEEPLVERMAIEDDIFLCLDQGLDQCMAVDVGPLDRRGAYDDAAWSRRPDHVDRRHATVRWMLLDR